MYGIMGDSFAIYLKRNWRILFVMLPTVQIKGPELYHLLEFLSLCFLLFLCCFYT